MIHRRQHHLNLHQTSHNHGLILRCIAVVVGRMALDVGITCFNHAVAWIAIIILAQSMGNLSWQGAREAGDVPAVSLIGVLSKEITTIRAMYVVILILIIPVGIALSKGEVLASCSPQTEWYHVLGEIRVLKQRVQLWPK